MRVYSYIVTFDSGFAPNPFHGVCTLACCKPQVRRSARVGDLIVGLASRGERFVYVLKVAEVMTFAEYWDDPRYIRKRPDWDSAATVARRGDNIYQPWGIGEFRQLPSNHSHPDGSEKISSKRTDLGGQRVLVGKPFTYFGKEGPPVPHELDFLKTGRGHRCRFEAVQVAQVARWFGGLPRGVRGRPAIWPSGEGFSQRSCG